MNRIERTKWQIEKSIIEAYLEKPTALSIKEIAADPNLPSAATIRKHIWDIPGLDYTTKEIGMYSTDYPMMHTGRYRTVDAWQPSRVAIIKYFRTVIRDRWVATARREAS